MCSSPRPALHYAYAGHTLASALPLPELAAVEVEADTPAIPIALVPGAIQHGEIAWLHHWLDGDNATDLSLARVADGFVLRFPGQADIVLADAGDIRIIGFPGTSERSLRHLLLDQALPRLLAHRGNLVLHASAAITADDRAILVMGESGQGKSTLATALAAQSGGAVLADDCVLAACEGGRLLAIPNYPGLRLWSDSLAKLFPAQTPTDLVSDTSAKLRVAVPAARVGTAGNTAAKGRIVAAILVLDGDSDAADGDTRMSALNASDACMALIRNSFQLDVGNARHVYRLLRLAAAAAQRVPVLSLCYPREYAALPQVAQTILDRIA